MNVLSNKNQQPRVRREPLALNAIEAPTVEAAAAEFERLYRADPEGLHRPGVCRHCGASLGDSPADRVISMGNFGYLPNICCEPCSEAGKRKYALAESAAIEAQFAAMIPVEFRYWDHSLGNNIARDRVLARFRLDSKKGLILFGSSGTCKTRLLWCIARVIVEHNVKAPHEAYTWLFCDSQELASKFIPTEAERADYLFIDDLGNETMSSKFANAFLYLIRKRCDWRRPTFISTQLTTDRFKSRFFEGTTPEAILRRLREHAIGIGTDNVTDTAKTSPAFLS